MKDKGSILVLSLISVLVLSILAAGLLTVGQTETESTQNYQLKKRAYYEASRGIEEMRKFIIDSDEGQAAVIGKQVHMNDTKWYGDGDVEYYYITGTMIDLENITRGVAMAQPGPITVWEGIQAPPISAFSLVLKVGDIDTGDIKTTIYKVPITSRVKYGDNTSYGEIVAGVLGLLH